MSRSYPLFLVSLLLGVGIGFMLPSRNALSDQAPEIQNGTMNAPDSDPASDAWTLELEARNAKLELELDSMRRDLEANERRVAAMLKTQSDSAALAEPDDTQLSIYKRQWVANALKNPGAHPMNRRFEWELQRLSENLDLTPDQAGAIGSLLDQRQEQRRVQILVDLGLLSKEEYERMFPELLSFDYDQSLRTMLSSNQLEKLQVIETAERDAGLERISRNVAQRLGVFEVDRFTSTESLVIEAAIRYALNQGNQLSIPPAIGELAIPPSTKRILSAAFQQLDSATFSKLYQTVLEMAEEGSPAGAGGARRGGVGRGGTGPNRRE